MSVDVAYEVWGEGRMNLPTAIIRGNASNVWYFVGTVLVLSVDKFPAHT